MAKMAGQIDLKVLLHFSADFSSIPGPLDRCRRAMPDAARKAEFTLKTEAP
jgi:hypothetical protein